MIAFGYHLDIKRCSIIWYHVNVDPNIYVWVYIDSHRLSIYTHTYMLCSAKKNWDPKRHRILMMMSTWCLDPLGLASCEHHHDAHLSHYSHLWSHISSNFYLLTSNMILHHLHIMTSHTHHTHIHTYYSHVDPTITPIMTHIQTLIRLIGTLWVPITLITSLMLVIIYDSKWELWPH